MKKFCYILMLMFGAYLAAEAQIVSMSTSATFADNEESVAGGFGYADRYAKELLGIGKSGKVAILTAFNKVENIKGATLKYVDVVLAASYPDDNGAVLVLDKDMKVVYMEKKTIKVRLNHLELSNPYKFSSDDPYYIGYLVHSTKDAGHPLGFDKQENIKNGCYMGVHDVMPKQGESLGDKILNTVEKGYNFGTLMIFAGLENAPALENLGYLLELDGVFNATANQEVKAVARVRNIGLKNISSEEFKVMVGGKPQEIKKEILVEAGKTVALPIEVKMPAEGTGKVELQLQKINGKENPLSAIVAAKTYTILKENGPFPRETVLIEHFTTEKCQNCPAADPVFKAYIESFAKAGLKVSVIEHHAGFDTDPFTIKESESLLDYLGVNFAPAAAIDRLQLGESKECAFFPRISYTEDFRKMLKDNLEYGRIEKIEQSGDNGMVAVKVTGSLVAGFTGDLYLTAVVTESELPAIKQAGAKGEFIHHDVARMFLSSAMGDKAVVNGNKFEITFPKKAFDKAWKAKNMKIVVVGHRVIDKAAMKDYKQRAVLFSSNVEWKASNGVDTIDGEQAPVVRVKDGLVIVDGAFDSVEVYGMDGCLKMTSVEQRLSAGWYVVKVNKGSSCWTEKIIVE